MKTRDENGESNEFPKEFNKKQKIKRDFILKLYPVKYDGKLYDKDHCDELFIAYYTCLEALNYEGGVYLSDGSWIYPDGYIEHDENR